MKITKRQLKQIIKEELIHVLHKHYGAQQPGEDLVEGSMYLRQQIPYIIEDAHELWGNPMTAETEEFSKKLMNELFSQISGTVLIDNLTSIPKFLAFRLCAELEGRSPRDCFSQYVRASG
jgi:hypothetical protein